MNQGSRSIPKCLKICWIGCKTAKQTNEELHVNKTIGGNLLNTYHLCLSWRPNPGRRVQNQTLYHVAVKASSYREAVQVLINYALPHFCLCRIIRLIRYKNVISFIWVYTVVVCQWSYSLVSCLLKFFSKHYSHKHMHYQSKCWAL